MRKKTCGHVFWVHLFYLPALSFLLHYRSLHAVLLHPPPPFSPPTSDLILSVNTCTIVESVSVRFNKMMSLLYFDFSLQSACINRYFYMPLLPCVRAFLSSHACIHACVYMYALAYLFVSVYVRARGCVYVCVCVWEREKRG